MKIGKANTHRTGKRLKSIGVFDLIAMLKP